MERIAIWDTTSRCNLKCKHCYNQERYWEKASLYPDLTQLQIKTIIEKIKKLGFTRLHLLGGEPLLSPNLMDFIRIGRQYHLDVTMVTNGTLLTARKMKELCLNGLSSISFSIDGTTAQSNDAIRGLGSFGKAIGNLKECIAMRDELNSDLKKSNPVRVVISFTLTKDNFETSTDLMSFARKIGVNAVNISYLSEEGEARNDYNNKALIEEEKFAFLDLLLEDAKHSKEVELHIDSRGCLAEYIYKRHGIKVDFSESSCAGGSEQFYILADGTLLPCSPLGTSMGELCNQKLLESSLPPNLLKNSVFEIENSEYLIEFYNYVHSYKTYENLVPCGDCKHNCTPCPLLYKRSNNKVLECIYAIQRIREVDRAVLSATIIKK